MGMWGYHSSQGDATLDFLDDQPCSDKQWNRCVEKTLNEVNAEKAGYDDVEYADRAIPVLGVTAVALENEVKLELSLLERVIAIAQKVISLPRSIHEFDDPDARIDAVRKELALFEDAHKNGGETSLQLEAPGLIDTMIRKMGEESGQP